VEAWFGTMSAGLTASESVAQLGAGDPVEDAVDDALELALVVAVAVADGVAVAEAVAEADGLLVRVGEALDVGQLAEGFGEPVGDDEVVGAGVLPLIV
jgi:hypothetical protein